MLYQAHRGVCTECPENTLPAFQKAWEQGYGVIEMDPKFTSDGVCVLLHDWNINRTCRSAAGESFLDPMPIGELTWAEAQKLDAGSWFSQAFAGTPIPTLVQTLDCCRDWGVHVKIDNVFGHFTPEQQKILFDEAAASGADVGFTCYNLDMVRLVVSRLPKATVHYDGPVTEENLLAVQAALRENPLVVWLPLDVDWCKMPSATPELCRLAKQFGKLGLWILETKEQEAKAIALGADIIETPGHLKP